MAFQSANGFRGQQQSGQSGQQRPRPRPPTLNQPGGQRLGQPGQLGGQQPVQKPGAPPTFSPNARKIQQPGSQYGSQQQSGLYNPQQPRMPTLSEHGRPAGPQPWMGRPRMHEQAPGWQPPQFGSMDDSLKWMREGGNAFGASPWQASRVQQGLQSATGVMKGLTPEQTTQMWGQLTPDEQAGYTKSYGELYNGDLPADINTQTFQSHLRSGVIDSMREQFNPYGAAYGQYQQHQQQQEPQPSRNMANDPRFMRGMDAMRHRR